jgi:hypothetical protein
MKLRQALQSCPTGLLRKIAASSGLPVETTTLRAELVDGLAAQLTRAARERLLWAALDSDERVAVALVEGAGGRHEADLLSSRLDARGASADRARSASETLARVVERGALFRVFETEAPAPGTYYVLPDEFLGSIDAPAAEVSAVRSAAVDLVPDETRRNDPIHDCFVLASALRREGWNRVSRQLLARTGPTFDRLLGALQPAVAAPDRSPPRLRWRFFVELGRLGGWLEGGRWPAPVDDRVRALFDDRGATQSALWHAYIAGPAGAREREVGLEGRVADPVRRAVLQLLAELPPGAWLSIPRLKDGLLSELGGHQSASRSLPELDNWIFGPWFWLGLVVLGRSSEGWTLVATTTALRDVAGRGAEPMPSAQASPCELTPDLQLRAPASADLAALYEAERYLAYAGGESPRRYSLTAASFARGVRLGGSASEAAALLEHLARAPLPAEWRRALEAWQASVGRLHIDARLLLSAADADSLDRALRVREVGETVGEILSERHAWIVPDRLGDLLTALVAAGQPVTVDPALRLESARPGVAAAMGGGAAELLWTLLHAVLAVDRAALGSLGAWEAVATALDALVPASSRASLERRADALAERLRRPRGGRRSRAE